MEQRSRLRRYLIPNHPLFHLARSMVINPIARRRQDDSQKRIIGEYRMAVVPLYVLRLVISPRHFAPIGEWGSYSALWGFDAQQRRDRRWLQETNPASPYPAGNRLPRPYVPSYASGFCWRLAHRGVTLPFRESSRAFTLYIAYDV